MLHLTYTPSGWDFPLGGCNLCVQLCVCVCVCVEFEMHRGVWREDGEVCVRWGAVCFCSWLPEKHSAHAAAAAHPRQWQCCLAFRARGQGGASHHLPTKAQVSQPASAPPPLPPLPFLPPYLTSPCSKGTKNLTCPHSPLLVLPSPPFAFMVQYLHPPLIRHTPFSVSSSFANFMNSLSSFGFP